MFPFVMEKITTAKVETSQMSKSKIQVINEENFKLNENSRRCMEFYQNCLQKSTFTPIPKLIETSSFFVAQKK